MTSRKKPKGAKRRKAPAPRPVPVEREQFPEPIGEAASIDYEEPDESDPFEGSKPAPSFWRKVGRFVFGED